MAVKNVNELLKQESVSLADKYLRVKVLRDGYTRTHEGHYAYKAVEEDGELFLFPVETDGKGTLKVMKDSPIAYTDEDNIHFVVNTLTDPYTQAHIRTEDIKGLDKGKQLIQAFLAFVEDRFRFGVYNIFVTTDVEEAFTLRDAEDNDADKIEDAYGRAFEDMSASYPTGNAREDVKGTDSGEGQGDTSEPSKPSKPTDIEVEPSEEGAKVSAKQE